MLAIIPARAGSVRIPKKNLIDFNGKPLIAWTIEAAISSNEIDQILVSTDSEEICEIAKAYGVLCPFKRPENLSDSNAMMVDVVIHAISWFENNFKSVNEIILLQPTSPLRTSEHINEAIKKYNTTDSDSLVSVVEIPHTMHPDITHKLSGDYLVPFCEQHKNNQMEVSRKKAFARNGPAILINTSANFKKRKKFGDKLAFYLMNKCDSIDIDNEDDLLLADYYYRCQK